MEARKQEQEVDVDSEQDDSEEDDLSSHEEEPKETDGQGEHDDGEVIDFDGEFRYRLESFGFTDNNNRETSKNLSKLFIRYRDGEGDNDKFVDTMDMGFIKSFDDIMLKYKGKQVRFATFL